MELTKEEIQKYIDGTEEIHREFKERLRKIEEERDAKISLILHKIEERKKKEILERINNL